MLRRAVSHAGSILAVPGPSSITNFEPDASLIPPPVKYSRAIVSHVPGGSFGPVAGPEAIPAKLSRATRNSPALLMFITVAPGTLGAAVADPRTTWILLAG
ncbi:MAG: hypothetical protein SWO11_21750 [Thermodesulfobacteriota bacterium]|nr:hypothetical protein [Thermodesulfobacteriota bacterium]